MALGGEQDFGLFGVQSGPDSCSCICTNTLGSNPMIHVSVWAYSGPEVRGWCLLIYICNFHVLSNLLLIYICKLHWNLNTMFVCQVNPF
jgi:hypothetical protein